MSTQLPSLGKSFGAAYIGATVAAILFGITNLQAARYYRKYPNDWLLYRYSVAALWILDTIHVALTTHAVYFYLVDSFGNFPALTEIVWSLKYLIHILIVVGVQAIYAIRIWKLGGHLHRILPWIVFLAVAAVFGGLYDYLICLAA
ncbi:uncharacterized protein EV420DRAFT_1647911 [Desarmillaria tabescens]|uniref:Uncharacterized protein n=1 Tax=Armillaria tabescens TaxID=1929756 RepID=A0AA39JQR3_ARMTA|nr:uncharacterized protein EV420DRAFT_1647911 [Desarmillaria tabescens]KAK0447014.1 hypothetical protein EV420DRAFT_1647911 [Desarmillaria tabescens]